MIIGFGDHGRWFSVPPGPDGDGDRLAGLARALGAACAGACAFAPPVTLRITVLDSPEHRLRTAGAVLIHTGEDLVLLGTGRPLRTPAAGVPATAAALANGPLAAALPRIGGPDKRLLVLGSFTLTAHTASVRDAAGHTLLRCVRLRLDDAPGQTTAAPQHALRVDAVRGHDAPFAAAVRALLADGLGGLPGDPLHARALALPLRYPLPPELPVCADADQPALAMLRRLLAAGVERLRALEAGTRDDADASFLHRYRVTLRVLRSVCWQLRAALAEDVAERIKDELGGLARAANRLRDLDVQLADPQTLAATLPAELACGFAGLLEGLRAERAAAQAAYAALLDSPAHHAHLDGLHALAQAPAQALAGAAAVRPIADLARERCWALYRGIRRRARAVDAGTPDHELHELRIRCKRLRYLLDLCGAVVAPGDHARLIVQLKALQAVLGDFNDAAVQHASLLALPFARAMPADQAAAVGMLAANTAERRRRLRGELAATRNDWRRLFAPADAGRPEGDAGAAAAPANRPSA
jgi:CHAD domain-containing protein